MTNPSIIPSPCEEDDAVSETSKSAKELWSSLWTCPPISPLTTMTSMAAIAFLFYGSIWGLTAKEAMPGGPVFGLFMLALVCYLGGQFTKLIKLPTLVGMMVFGFILRNVPAINIAKDIPSEWGSNIRHMALILILLRAGLEVDSDILLKQKATCTKLIFIPFIFELVAGSLAAKYLLDMPWLWAFTLGSMLSAVSPAVVLPVMLKLQKKGIGTENGVPTMVIAVAGIDDVLALTAYEVLFGVLMGKGNMEWLIARGPIEVIVGIIYGIALGIFLWYIPHPEERKTSVFRFLLLLLGGMFCLFGSQQIEWGAAGALGCICLPFVAAIRWKKHKDWDDEENPVGEALAFIWKIIEPFLFGLIGSEIKLEMLKPTLVGLSLATMFIALFFRMAASMLAAWTAGLSFKEQVFVTFAGLPKATVQAAIGPQALNYVRGDEELAGQKDLIAHATMILTVAVLAIIIFAPLGSVLISILAPRLLSKPTNNDVEKSKTSVPAIMDSIPMYQQNSSYDIKNENRLSNPENSNSREHQNNQYSSSSVCSQNWRNIENNSNVNTSEKL
ncbi:hypothetical protein JTE90_001680 [Oedothorax gibbosus]|uniref:Cation/H+ exchanger transmembrane domain-containing protein n=1 Tax=Oedothorax gibbosus TaxID=931172 RepID=A0AAV6UHS6_9ARAC|nr:hypothetical protein JTE90_001680 [Oedothorax gibbosus]